VDPSSACQRLLNAAVHGLRNKVVAAGLDIAKQAADMNNLPRVETAEDVENYSTSRIMDLAYRMGVLRRSEWRRLKRCYGIRRDLEHEDDEYEAGPEDCFYIFKTCIEVVLSRDPVQLLRVTDVKEAIEQDKAQFPEQQFLDKFTSAPDPRQREIMLFLTSTSLDGEKADVVRSNAVEMMKHLRDSTRAAVTIEIAKYLQDRIGRRVASLLFMKVAEAAGATAYLKKASRSGYFADLLKRLKQVGHNWTNYEGHGTLLDELEDVGGVTQCPLEDVANGIVKWLTLCFVGTPGGRTRYGHVRHVFYSDIAALIITRLAKDFNARELQFLRDMRDDRDVKRAIGQSPAILNRYENMLDLAGDM